MLRIPNKKRCLVPIFALCLVTNAAFAFRSEAQEGPQFYSSVREKHIGTVYEGDAARYAFPIKNTGDAPLIVRVSGVSCQCNLPYGKELIIGPGKTDELVLEDTATKPGNYHVYAQLWTNDPIAGSVRVVLSYELAQRVTLVPESIELESVDWPKEQVETIWLHMAPGTSFTNAEYDAAAINVERIETDSSNQRVGLRVEAKIGVPIASINTSIKLRFSQFGRTLTKVVPFRAAWRFPLVAEEPLTMIGIVPEGDSRHVTLFFRSRLESVDLNDIECVLRHDSTQMKVSGVSVDENRVLVKLTFNALNEGRAFATVTIRNQEDILGCTTVHAYVSDSLTTDR